tara:strand:+ start:651 stop:878 length:228 start_codon:yes stop_codon:yes gene_type:complete
MTKLTDNELSQIKELNSEFAKNKSAIGDLELQKRSIFERMDVIQNEFSKVEKKLMKKYGEDSVVNLQTGEVTKKE